MKPDAADIHPAPVERLSFVFLISLSRLSMHRPAPLLIAVLLLSASPADAGVHIGLGTVDEIDGVNSAGATVSWETSQRHPWEIMGGVIRARHKADLTTPRVLFATISKRFTWKGLFVQGGIATTSSDTEVLSGHWQFVTGVGYRHDRFTVSVRHLSNADTTGRNRGENLLLVQYGF